MDLILDRSKSLKEINWIIIKIKKHSTNQERVNSILGLVRVIWQLISYQVYYFQWMYWFLEGPCPLVSVVICIFCFNGNLFVQKKLYKS